MRIELVHPPTKEEERKKQNHAEILRQQAESLKTETNRRKRWTAAEEKLVMTSKLKDIELAEFLGRTFFAVKTKRRNLRREQEG